MFAYIILGHCVRLHYILCRRLKRKRDCCLGVLSPTLGPAELVWMCLRILKKGFCLKGRGRQAREYNSQFWVAFSPKALCFPRILTGMAKSKWQSDLSCRQFVDLPACWQMCSFRSLQYSLPPSPPTPNLRVLGGKEVARVETYFCIRA